MVQARSNLPDSYLRRLRAAERWSWVKPPSLRGLLERIAFPDDRRIALDTPLGLRLYTDPLSFAGRKLTQGEDLEPETVATMRQHVKPGDVALDIGANEGIFTALMGSIVGRNGLVVAVEPQSRLVNIIEINLRLNDIHHFKIYNNAIGGQENETATIHLYPGANTGQSSIVKKPRALWTAFRRDDETIQFISPEQILRETGRNRFDFVKVDVEGFESKVVPALLPLLRGGKIGCLFLDFHRPILEAQNVNADALHQSVCDAGMKPIEGDTRALSGYVLYKPASA